MTAIVTPQVLFGPGIAWATRTDISGATPFNVGYVNEFSFDATFNEKSLYGQYQAPLVIARGTEKITGKLKTAMASSQALSAFLVGQNWTTGTQYDATSVTNAVPATTPYTVTPTVPSTGTFDKNLGVVNATTRAPLTLGASLEALETGEYYVDETTGEYTFAAADKDVSVIITFAYKYTKGATGQSLTWNNQLIGTTPTFQLDYKNTFEGITYYLRLFKCTAGKTSLGHKLDDYAMPEYDVSIMDNGAQQIGVISLGTLA